MISSIKFETRQTDGFSKSTVKYILFVHILSNISNVPCDTLVTEKEKSIIALQEKQYTTTL